MEGRARSRISFRRVKGTGSSSQVLRGKFFKTDFTSSLDTAWKFDKNNPGKTGCWTFSFDTSKFSQIFVTYITFGSPPSSQKILDLIHGL